MLGAVLLDDQAPPLVSRVQREGRVRILYTVVITIPNPALAELPSRQANSFRIRPMQVEWFGWIKRWLGHEPWPIAAIDLGGMNQEWMAKINCPAFSSGDDFWQWAVPPNPFPLRTVPPHPQAQESLPHPNESRPESLSVQRDRQHPKRGKASTNRVRVSLNLPARTKIHLGRNLRRENSRPHASRYRRCLPCWGTSPERFRG